MPPGYPGYVYLCPNAPEYPALLTPWVAVIGSFAYGLWIEAALLALGSLWLWRRKSLPYGSVFSFGVVTASALVASIADALTIQRNRETCRFLFLGDQHFRPDNYADIIHGLNASITQANFAFEVAALMLLIGTFAAARVAVLGWRGRR